MKEGRGRDKGNRHMEAELEEIDTLQQFSDLLVSTPLIDSSLLQDLKELFYADCTYLYLPYQKLN